MESKYRRLLLKMSGEALGGKDGRGIDFDFTGRVCQAVRRCVEAGIQVAVVVGGGTTGGAARTGGTGWSAPGPTTWACWPPP